MLLDYIPPSPGSNYIWYPVNAAQETALESPAEFLMYGGGSGGGKTDFLVADACQERDNKNLRAIIIRRAFTEMANIMDRTGAIYRQMGAYWRGNPHNHWLFPSGAQVRLGYISAEKHVSNYQGNPFTYLGVDESTHQREKHIRDILPWLATTDASLRPRVRMATNPGNIGADWHMGLFLKGKCPLHFPDESVKPGAVYRGAKWPSDGEPVHKTVSFVPALVKDNPLYGEQKLNALKSQTKEIREKLLTGCWCALEGRYFSFLTDGHKFPYAKVGEQYWWTRIISIDYGFGDSSAAAGLYTTNEIGKTFKIAEKIRQRMDSKTFAKEVCEEWATRKLQGQPAIVSAAFFDPANDAHTGTGKSNFDIMQEVFEKYDIPCLKAAKDRIGNAQNAYNRLDEGTLVLCDTAPMTHKSFMTRMHDPKTPGDVLKVKGDPLDDLYDETVYAANTFTDDADKPREVQIAEKIRQMQERGLDEHSISINTMRMHMEHREEDAPARLGRVKRPIIRR